MSYDMFESAIYYLPFGKQEKWPFERLLHHVIEPDQASGASLEAGNGGDTLLLVCTVMVGGGRTSKCLEKHSALCVTN